MKLTANADGKILDDCSLENHNYQVDPYIGCEHCCYYCYALNQAKTDWTQEISTYKDIKKRLNAELTGITPQTIYLGWQTDPYQPCEADSKQTRKVLELLLDKGFSANILTKSDLVLRDMDLLRQMPEASISFSVAFTDDRIRRLFEHHTIETEKRIATLAELKSNGIRTASLICPIIPYMTNVLELIDQLEPYTAKIWLYSLMIPDRSDINWQNIKQILQDNFPKFFENVEAAIFSKDHPFWKELNRDLTDLLKQRTIDLSIHI